MIQVDVAALTFVVSTLIPVLTALVTKAHAHSGVKAVITALLSAVAGAATIAIAHEGQVDPGHVAVSIAVAWFTAVTTHFGLLKPVGVTGGLGAVAQSTRRIGVG
jgi:hypothetical protein